MPSSNTLLTFSFFPHLNRLFCCGGLFVCLFVYVSLFCFLVCYLFHVIIVLNILLVCRCGGGFLLGLVCLISFVVVFVEWGL